MDIKTVLNLDANCVIECRPQFNGNCIYFSVEVLDDDVFVEIDVEMLAKQGEFNASANNDAYDVDDLVCQVLSKYSIGWGDDDDY